MRDPAFIFEDIDRLVHFALTHSVSELDVLPLFLKPVKQKAPQLKLASPVGFPFGHQAIEAKLSETVLALVDGADEIEWILNMPAIRSGDYQYMAKEISTFLPVLSKMGKRGSLGLDVTFLDKEAINAICNIIGPSSVFAVHLFSDDTASLPGKLAQARVLLPDAIRVRTGIVNNQPDIENLHADLLSLCCTIADIRDKE